jgi:hypothetical protein
MVDRAVKLGLFFLFGFLFFGHSSASVHTRNEGILIQKDIGCVLSKESFYSPDPLRAIFEFAATINEVDPSDDNDQNGNDNWTPLICGQSTCGLSQISYDVSDHIFHLTQSLQNRSTVPLFILFHSWKSYLS